MKHKVEVNGGRLFAVMEYFFGINVIFVIFSVNKIQVGKAQETSYWYSGSHLQDGKRTYNVLTNEKMAKKMEVEYQQRF